MKLQQSTESADESSLKSIDSTSLLTDPILPTRKSPISMHSKLFQGCVPLAGFRRSFSLPRHNYTPNKHKTLIDSYDSDVYCKQDSHYNEVGTEKLSRSAGFDRLLSSSACWLKESPTKCKRLKNRSTMSHKHAERKLLSGHDNLIFESSDVNLNDNINNSLFTKQPISATTDNTPLFCDPILTELETELPVPPPPPRACPPWLKVALAKQAQTPCFSLSSPSITSPQNQMGLEHNRFSVRIYPILQNGVKMSDTHYWLLDPPKPKSFYHQSVFGPQNIDSVYTPPASPLSMPDTGYLNLDSARSNEMNEPFYRDVKLRRGQSEITKDCIHNFHHELVLRLMKTVPLATEPECQAVLIGTNYDFAEANKRLKLELLCRKGYFSRAHNRRLLIKYDWDLEFTFQQAQLEFESRKLRRQNKNLLKQWDTMKYSTSPQLMRNYSSTSSDSSTSSPVPGTFPQSTSLNYNDNESTISVLSMGQTSHSHLYTSKPT